jgi:hypothetical protein
MTTIINADTSGGLKLTSDTSGALDIQSAGSTKLAMDSSGNVGIGATSPSKPLQVKQTAAGSGLSQTDIRATRDEYGADFSGYIDQGVGHGAIISSVDNGTATERVRITNAGNLGIGTSSPSTPLHVNGAITVGQINAASGSKIYTAGSGTYELDIAGALSLTSGRDNGASMLFNVSGAEKMRIDAAGKVGIGTTAPDSLLEIASGGATTAKVSTSATNSYAEMIFEDGNAGYGFQVRSDGAQSISAGSMVINDRDTGSFPFVIKEGNATNTVVLSGSNTCFNSTAIGFANQRAVQIQTSSTGLIAIQHLNTEVSGAAYIWFTHNGGAIGSIVQDGTSGLTYNTASDYRLKENVNYSWDATTRLKQLKPARFNFITDQEKGTVDGFLAHEVSNVVPNATTGEKDAVDDDNKPIHQQIDHSKLVPLLVKTIQELEARITALEAG